jgi:IMP dehydrogenase
MEGELATVTVGDLMIRHPVTLGESDPIGRAIDLIRQHRLRVLPVVRGDRIVGVVTPEHLLRQPLYRPVAEVMLRDIEPATPDLLPVQAQGLLTRYGISALPVAQDGRLVGVVSLEAVLQAAGQHTDPLTGLPWSPALRAWASAVLRNDREVAILFVDLDNFGLVNKAHGHVAGDDLLRAVAHLLQTCVDPATDVLCRYGGDEFAIATTRREPEVRLLADQIRRTLNLPLQVGGAVHRLTASVGFAGGRRGERRASSHIMATVEDLITRASRASTLDKERRRAVPEEGEGRPTLLSESETRVRLRGITAASSDEGCVVSVSLAAGTRVVTGMASGNRRRETMARIATRATLEALSGLGGGGCTFAVEEVFEVARGNETLVTVVVTAAGQIVGRYVGAAQAQDPPHAAVRAVLSALNRRLGRVVGAVLRSREPAGAPEDEVR